MGAIGTAIKQKLQDRFNPSQLEVIDESHKHAHHRGAAEHRAQGGPAESHIHVIIVSSAFKDMGVLAKHRAVKAVLEAEIAQIHAFSLEVRIE